MAQLKSTSIIGNLSVSGNIIASKFILNDGDNTKLLLDGGNTKLISDFATSANLTAATTAISNLEAGKVDKAGDTMTGLLKTVFKESVATGSYQAAATTIPTLIEEVRYSNGCMGSVSIAENYTNNSITITGSWYNFLYIPHRSGGDEGAANGDNCNYGTLFLMGMTGANGYYRIRFSNSSIAEVEKIISSSGGNIYGNLNFQGNVSPLTTNTGSIGTNNLKWNAVYATNLYGHATSASQLATSIVFTPADTALTMANVRDLIGNNSQIRRGSWSYAANGYIASGSAAGQCPFGPLDLAGTTVIQANNNNSAYTQIYITPPTASTSGAIKGEMLYYIDNGTNYSPTWRRVLTNDNYDLYALPLTGGTVTGTLVLSNTQDLSGTANNKPALIIGGTDTSAHIEIDSNEIQAKGTGTTVGPLYLNNDGGLVTIGSDGLQSNGDVKLASGKNIYLQGSNVDQFIYFQHSGSETGYDWRAGALGTGSGDGNYFVIQSNSTTGTYSNAIRIGLTSLDTAFGGNVYPLVNNSKTLGTSDLRWSNVYATTFTGSLSGNATTSSYPLGFNTNGGNITWGTLTGDTTTTTGYRTIARWDSPNGGSVAFADGPMNDNTKKGQTSMQIDGYFYQNEGQYRVIDTNSGDSRYLKLSGGTMTGTLTLEPTSGEGGQILLNAAANDQTSNGIAIDTAWGDFRLFGLASRDGTTKAGIGSIFTFDPYEQKISIITETQGSSHFQYNTSDKCIDVIFN